MSALRRRKADAGCTPRGGGGRDVTQACLLYVNVIQSVSTTSKRIEADVSTVLQLQEAHSMVLEQAGLSVDPLWRTDWEAPIESDYT